MGFITDHFLVIALTTAGIATFVWLLRFRERLRMKWWSAMVLAVLHVVYGVCTVKLFAALEGAPGGMSLFGAVFLMPLGYYVGAKLTKRSVADVFDVFTVPLAFTLMLARCNCLVAGCCYGGFIPGTALRWPTREAELIYYAVFLFLLAPKVQRGETRGRAYPLYMLSYGAFRAVTEFFRHSAAATGIFHLSHVWAILTLGLGLSIYAEMKNRRKKSNVHNRRG